MRYTAWVVALLPIGCSRGDPDYNFDNGIKAYQEGDMIKARVCFDEAIKDDPSNGQAYYQRGLANQKMTNSGDAILDFTKALRLLGDHAGAYFHRGCVLYDVEKYNLAEEDMKRAVELDASLQVKVDEHKARWSFRKKKGSDLPNDR